MRVMFDDLLTANQDYQRNFALGELTAPARRGLAVVTCIDSRIEPLAMLGLEPGDAKILRNAGARVTSDVLRSLVLAVNFLEVSRICLVQHTDCAMAKSSDDEFRAQLGERGLDASACEFHAIGEPDETLRHDVALIRDNPLMPGIVVAGFRYDVRTGALHPVPTG
jgi:carbonic anhydrase